MARELAEVLHYFLEDAEPVAAVAVEPPGRLALPLEPDETLRACFVAELAARLAARGAGVSLVGPRELLALLPPAAPGVRVEPPGPGAPAAEAALHEATWRLELVRADREPTPPAAGPPPWSLLFVTPDAEDLALARQRIRAVLGRAPGARVGVTVHGVRDLDEAERTFLRLAAEAEADGADELLSYGAILDELDVLRALVTGRGGLELPPVSRARRSLADVAALLASDRSGRPDGPSEPSAERKG